LITLLLIQKTGYLQLFAHNFIVFVVLREQPLVFTEEVSIWELKTWK